MTKRLPSCPDYLRVREILVKKVFPELRRKGMATQTSHPHYTETSSLYEMSERVTKKGKRGGLVFWTLQDNEGFRETGLVRLAFNHSDEDPSPEMVLEVGLIVEEVCKKHSLKTEWNQNPRRRIKVF